VPQTQFITCAAVRICEPSSNKILNFYLSLWHVASCNFVEVSPLGSLLCFNYSFVCFYYSSYVCLNCFVCFAVYFLCSVFFYCFVYSFSLCALLWLFLFYLCASVRSTVQTRLQLINITSSVTGLHDCNEGGGHVLWIVGTLEYPASHPRRE
jgi:hypothetical protein